MKATARLHELGQSLWLDNITRTMLGDGTLQGYIDELSVTGLTSNPTIFDKAISGGDTYDEQIAEVSAAAEAGEGTGANADERVFFELAAGRPARRDQPLRRRSRAHRRGRRLRLAGGLAAARRRRRGDDRAGGGAPRQGRAREPLHQDPRHRGGLAGDRGVDLRRHPDQRHPALRRPAVPRRRRGLHARGRAPDRGRARPRRRLGRLDLHEPLGRRRRRGGAGRAAQPARHRRRRPRLRRLPRAARLAPHAAPDERGRPRPSGCSGPAPGPRTRTPPTPSTSRPSPPPSRSTRCRSRPCSPSPTTARSAT